MVNFAFKLYLYFARAHSSFKSGVMIKRQKKPGSCSNIQYSLKLNFYSCFFLQLAIKLSVSKLYDTNLSVLCI